MVDIDLPLIAKRLDGIGERLTSLETGQQTILDTLGKIAEAVDGNTFAIRALAGAHTDHEHRISALEAIQSNQ